MSPERDEAADRVIFRLALETDGHGYERIVWYDSHRECDCGEGIRHIFLADNAALA
jgi:hypothetical protein